VWEDKQFFAFPLELAYPTISFAFLLFKPFSVLFSLMEVFPLSREILFTTAMKNPRVATSLFGSPGVSFVGIWILFFLPGIFVPVTPFPPSRVKRVVHASFFFQRSPFD